MNALKLIVNIIEYAVLIYFGIAALYIFIFGFAGIFNRKIKKFSSPSIRKVAILIPGYKEDAVIIDVAKEALKQNYPKEAMEVIVIADSFLPETISTLKQLPIRLIEVSFDVSTKSKALNKAMEILGDDYDIALILDADNIMAEDFVTQINQAFENNFVVVQGHRVAKNLNTSFAILDAISEELNNNIFRKGHRNLGFSSALIGSGMAFDYQFFKSTMANIKAVGGFDKELELELLKNKYKIEYLPAAIVLDEKIQKSEVFEKQRKRWISAQLIYFKRYFFKGITHLILKGNFDFFDKVYQMISPPRILLIGIVTILSIIYGAISLISPQSDFLALKLSNWLPVLSVTILAFLLSIPKQFYTLKTAKALSTLPKAFVLMLLSLFKLKGANKKFIHTEHGQIK